MKEYLPVGSVVLLKNGKKPILVIGYKVKSQDKKVLENDEVVDNDKAYDYCGVLYPEGIISSEIMYMFNNEDINDVLFKGYETKESKELSEYINSLEN